MLGLKCSFAIFCDIKKFRLDLIHNAINLLLDNPHLSNREVARQVGVSELSIRHWKKQPLWEQEQQKLIKERAEAMGVNQPDEREELKRKLEEQAKQLGRLFDGVYRNCMQALKITNDTLAELSKLDDPTKACYLATKAGTHIQMNMALAGAGVLVKLMEQKLQIGVLLKYFEKMDFNDDV